MKWKAVSMPALLSVLLCAVVLHTQAQTGSMPAWQKAAGGKAQFEVASIHMSAPGTFSSPSFPISADDSFMEPNGTFHADFPLTTYIEFAYKFWPTSSELHAMIAGLPDWVKKQNFTIQAKAPIDTTKDQFRLMMQDLLRERFALKVHFEEREVPALAMVLEKQGKTGPKLIPHDQGPPCDAKRQPGVFLGICYTYGARPLPDGSWVNYCRATTMDLLAAFIASTGESKGEIGRPVVDQTGLTGQWDFTLTMVPSPKPGADDPAPAGSTFLEAIHDQLGLTLKPVKAKVPVLVIDHVQQPSEN
jgi:uncharacterized protein (TIGR03435 family)